MAYKIVNNWLPSSLYSIKAPYAMSPQYITIHNTGNTASARNEGAYHNSNRNQVSYHVAIDDKEAVQLIPFNRTAWHAGDGMGAGNMRSIGIEISYSMDGGYSGAMSTRYKKAQDNTALYVAHVLKQYGWGVNRLRQHYDWSRKDCPHKMRARYGWDKFKQDVQRNLNALNKTTSKPASRPVAAKPKPAPKKPVVRNRATWGWHWSGTFQVSASSGIQVYRSKPGLINANKVGKTSNLEKGTWVNFDHIFMIDGHWWIRFKYAAKGSSTAYFFAPVGKKQTGITFRQASDKGRMWGKVTKLNSSESKSGVTNWHKKESVK